MTPTRDELAAQLARIRANGLLEMLSNAAVARGLPTAFAVAIASRETNCKNIRGDFHDDAYHGIGIVQIDTQHTIAVIASASGSWATDPAPLIDYGVTLLASNLAEVKSTLPLREIGDQMKIAAAGYNCGLSAALNAAMSGDCDARTTGKDYGGDVMARFAIFEDLLGCPA